MVCRASDPVYSAKLLVHARQLLVFADMFRGIGSKDFYTYVREEPELTPSHLPIDLWLTGPWLVGWLYRGGGGCCSSSSFLDEVCWGAIWLYQASGERAYLQQAEAAYADVAARDGFDNAAFGWNEKRAYLSHT